MSDASATDRLFLVLPSVLDVLERVVDETEQYVGARVEDEDFAYRVLLLTTEAVTNAIEHGNALDPDKSVRLTLACAGDVCTIVVEDEGEGFEREAVADPMGEDALLADGGRGLFLLESMASEVRYEDGGRRVVVVLDRARPPVVLVILPPATTHRRFEGPTAAAALLVGVAAMVLLGRDREALLAFAGAALFACAAHAWLYRTGALSLRGVLVGAVGLRALAFPLRPGLSDDTYRYVWDGLVQHLGLNPYLHRPTDAAVAALRDGPLFDLLNSVGYHTVYPPVSQLLFFVGTMGASDDWVVSYYATKAVLVALEAGGVLLLARMVDVRALALYALHPLVIMETAGQGHSEAALVPFLVGAVYFARRGRGAWTAAAVAAAGWVKLYPFALALFVVRRFGVRALVAGIAATVGLAWPYLDPAAPANALTSLRLYVRLFEFNAGPYYTVKHVLLVVTGSDWSKLLGPAFAAAFIASLAWIYRASGRGGWSLERTAVWVFGAYFLCATTLHPWYLVGLLVLLALAPRPGPQWWWIAAWSLTTYVRYDGAHAAWAYPLSVWIGWAGFALIAGRRYGGGAARRLLRVRGARKAERILPLLPRDRPLRLLDLGAGEGYVGERLARESGVEVVLADVHDAPRVALPYVRYDGRRLPFDDGSFDVVVLYFVLHHAADGDAVLREAIRTARRRVIVVESVYTTRAEHRRLRVLDRLVNRLRLEGAMQAQEAHLAFRTAADWRRAIRAAGGTIETEHRRGRFVHRQHVFVVAP